MCSCFSWKYYPDEDGLRTFEHILTLAAVSGRRSECEGAYRPLNGLLECEQSITSTANVSLVFVAFRLSPSALCRVTEIQRKHLFTYSST